MTHEERQRGIADAAAARTELYDTLGQLQNRLNYAQRVDDAIDDARGRLAAQREQKPATFVAGAVGVAALVGVTVWGIARVVMKRM